MDPFDGGSWALLGLTLAHSQRQPPTKFLRYLHVSRNMPVLQLYNAAV